MEIKISRQNFEKFSNIKFYENLSNESRADILKYLLTEIGLSPGGSTHLHTNTT
jgi:hypothetical protein